MIVMITAFLLILIGFWAMLTKKNLIRIIVGFAIADTGINILLVSIGYVRNKTAPIIDKAVTQNTGFNAAIEAVEKVVDPVPSALVLTAIVIGLAVTALMLAYAVRMHKTTGSLNIDDYEEQKW